MGQKFIWGNINGDRTVAQGSGNFNIATKVSTGHFTINFDTGFFNDIPAVTVTIFEPDMSNNHIIGAMLQSHDENSVELIIRSTATQNKYDNSFSFVAMGYGDDD